MHDGRVLVTGGAGLIGSHLTRRLLASGHEVVVLDDFSTSDRANLSGAVGHPALRLMEQDVAEPFDLDVEQIYHLACPASPVHYQRDPVRTIRTCVVGSFNVLELARRNGARVLLASTSEVYGDPLVHPQHEGYWGNVNPMGVRSCYDEGKRCAEALFTSYRLQHDVAIKVARIFNTYGPRMRPDDGRVVSTFIFKALNGVDLNVAGDGSQTRSFCFVDDLVDGLVRLQGTPHAVTGPINLGNPREVTILELAELVNRVVGSSSPVRFGPLPKDDPRRRKPVVDEARRVLGWTPTTSLEDGLRTTVEYLRQHEEWVSRRAARSDGERRGE